MDDSTKHQNRFENFSIRRVQLYNRAIENSMKFSKENDPLKPRSQKKVYCYFYTDGSINIKIPREYLMAVPMSWWKHCRFLDWKKIFGSEEPSSPDNPLSRVLRESEIYQDLFKLNDEAKTRIKAIALGEIKKQEDQGL